MTAPEHISEELKSYLTNMNTGDSARISAYDEVTVTLYDTVTAPGIFFADEDGVITHTEALSTETSAADIETLLTSKGFTTTSDESGLGSVFRKMVV